MNLNNEILWTGAASVVSFNAGKTHLASFDQSNNTGAVDVKMDEFVPDKKSSSKMPGSTFSSELDWGSYIIATAKSTTKKIGALIH